MQNGRSNEQATKEKRKKCIMACHLVVTCICGVSTRFHVTDEMATNNNYAPLI